MYSLLFEVTPREGHEGHYLARAQALRPALERHAGLLALDRFRSLARPAALLSAQRWRDEAAIDAWRRDRVHRGAQQAGRERHFADYRLRVSRVLATRLGASATEKAESPEDGLDAASREDAAAALAPGTIAASAFKPDAEADGARLHLIVESRGEALVGAFGEDAAAEAFASVYDASRLVVLADIESVARGEALLEALAAEPALARATLARSLRDYGMHDRREAPPDAIDRRR